MKTNLKATGMTMTETLSNYVDEKMKQIERVLDPKDESIQCDVEVGIHTKHHQSGNIFRAEINIHTAGNNFRAESEKEDLFVAINDAKEEIIHAITSKKTKARVAFRKGAGKVKEILKGFRK